MVFIDVLFEKRVINFDMIMIVSDARLDKMIGPVRVQIRVTGEGEVVVRAPLRMSRAEIMRILEGKRDWIEKTLEKVRSRETAPKFTEAELKAKGLTVDAVLQDNDAYHALKAVDGLIMTGPTGTNVNDVAVALVR